ncbi:MAG: SAM-dependent methyltransferase, partial [Nocardioides sp.]
TALLADGNVGIGGDPVTLLRRVRELLDPRGRIVVELAAPGAGLHSTWAELHCGEIRSRPFRWSVVGTDAIEGVAAEAGLALTESHTDGRRWCAVLEEPT